MTLGRVATIDLDEARKRARKELARVHLGADPVAERAEAKARDAITFGAVVNDYMARYAAKELRASTIRETDRYLRKHFASLSDLPIRKVARADIAAALARVVKDSGQAAANRGRDALSSLFSFAIKEGLCDLNPVLGTWRPTQPPRERTLSDNELALILRNAGSGDYAQIIRLLAMTGQRRGEIGGMRWPEIDLAAATWIIPAERAKNGQQHLVPLSPAAVSILAARALRPDTDCVFGSKAGPFNGWGKPKERLDARVLEALRTDDPEANLSRWTLHDLRRTAATGMARLGVQVEVVEKVLNHISGTFAGIVGTYQRHDYTREKRVALDLWAAHVERIAPSPA